MINSNSEYVSWLRGGVASFSGFEDGLGIVTYTRFLTPGQQVGVSNPSIGGLLTGGSLSDFVEQGPNGGMIIKSTSVTFLSFAFTLSLFLALQIDWGRREPIIWSISFSSDLYTSPFTNPVFTDSISDSYVPHPLTLSDRLRSF